MGRSVLNLYVCADDEAADHEKDKDYEERMRTQMDIFEFSLSLQSGLQPTVPTSALENVVDACRLSSLAVSLPSTSCSLADHITGRKITGYRKLESCSSCSCREGR